MSVIFPPGFPFAGWPAIDSHCPDPSPADPPDDDGDATPSKPADLTIVTASRLEPVFPEDCDHILMLQAPYHEASAYFAERPPEAAILLLGPKHDALITHILPDEDGMATPVSFTLAAASLNRQVKPFLAAGLDIHGIWHKHPPGVTSLSYGDLEYARKLFGNPKHRSLDRFVMPITAGRRAYGFVLTRDGNELGVRCARFVLV